MTHLDLFSGIGGFAYAADQVWDNVEHIFVEYDPFCQQVLKKHWPEAPIHGDIRQFNSDTFRAGRTGSLRQTKGRDRLRGRDRPAEKPFILTGGFPCQPFSTAGLRRGTADDRHLWPEMLRIIQFAKPTWVIAENVRGITNWNDGVVFEQVCTDLEAAGYEVQPFIIPAVAVNAPHRRDRVWFIAHTVDDRSGGTQPRSTATEGRLPQEHRSQHGTTREPERTDSNRYDHQPAANAPGQQHSGGLGLERQPHQEDSEPRSPDQDAPYPASSGLEGGTSSVKEQTLDGRTSRGWDTDWLEVAAELCRLDDGLPVGLGGFELSKSQHRKEQLKAYGNAIVPQVAVEIMRSLG